MLFSLMIISFICGDKGRACVNIVVENTVSIEAALVGNNRIKFDILYKYVLYR